MNKKIYYNKNMRCRISYFKLFDCLELQLQIKRYFFWFDVGHFLHLHLDQKTNGFPRPNPITINYQYAGKIEWWDEGTMTLENRARLMFKDQVKKIKQSEETKDRIKKLLA